MAHERRLAVHDLRGAHDLTPVDLTDALVAEADAEDRDPSGQLLDDLVADAGVLGTARPGRNEDCVRPSVDNLLNGDGVVPMHKGGSSQLPQVLHEVVDERVVIVDDEDPGTHHRRSYR